MSSGQVVVFGLGGTISMTASETGGVTPTLTPDELLASLPTLTQVVNVVDFRRLPGASLSFADLHELISAITDALNQGAAGIVVVQGTDTLEETAYLLDLWHHGPQPIVVTGAMRNPMQAGPDGPANLLAAIQTAAAPQATEQGVLVVMSDEIHAARRVRKAHSTSLGAFVSPNGGPLGLVVAGRPCLLNRLQHRFGVPRPTAVPTVGLVTMSLGDQGELLHEVENRLDGLVVAGMGVGHVPESLVPRMHDIASAIPIVLASRTGAGPVLTDTYGFPGSERDLLARGLVPAGFLDPLKARLMLYALLASGADRSTIAAAFGAAGGYAEPNTFPFTAIHSRMRLPS